LDKNLKQLKFVYTKMILYWYNAKDRDLSVMSWRSMVDKGSY